MKYFISNAPGTTFANVKTKTKEQMFNLSPKRGGAKDETNMDNKNKMIVMLQYRIKRYQAMGNGAMCQNLISQLHKLQNGNATNAN